MVSSPKPTTPPERIIFGRALALVRKRLDVTQEDAAARAPNRRGGQGIHTTTWQSYEWGEKDLSLERWTGLVEAIGGTREQLLEAYEEVRRGSAEDDEGGSAKVLPFKRAEQPAFLYIRGRVQAGAWLEVDELSQEEPRRYPLAPDPRFPGARQWLDVVVGDSMNLVPILDGDLVHCVDADDIGYAPKNGDIVKVERVRAGGGLTEVSVKQVEITAAGVMLMPRSTDLRFKPLAYTDGVSEDEDVEVRIAALVVSAVRRLG